MTAATSMASPSKSDPQSWNDTVTAIAFGLGVLILGTIIVVTVIRAAGRYVTTRRGTTTSRDPRHAIDTLHRKVDRIEQRMAGPTTAKTNESAAAVHPGHIDELGSEDACGQRFE
jgi:hypothetical protein